MKPMERPEDEQFSPTFRDANSGGAPWNNEEGGKLLAEETE